MNSRRLAVWRLAEWRSAEWGCRVRAGVYGARILIGLVVVALAGVALVGPAVAAAQEDPAVAAAQEDPAATAMTYLTTLYNSDWTALRELLDPDAVFDDPTATALVGAALAYRGRDQILERFEAGAVDAREGGFDVISYFVATDRVVYSLRYHTEIRGEVVGRPGAWIPVEVQGVTVIRVRSGLVVEHTDYIDYQALASQMAGGPPF